MKRAFLLIVVPALLVALGFAQTPAASMNTDQTKIKGCLAGSDGNYTVVEDNTGHTYKIGTSSADLKPHVGHDVTLIGHKASGASSAAADNSFAVTEVNMISEHCGAAAAAPAVTISTPAETTVPPAAPAAAAPAATRSTPAETAVTPAVTASAAPAATVSTPAETAVPPAVVPAEPTATVSTPAETASTPAMTTVEPAATVSTPAAAAAEPTATVVSTPAETASTADAHPTRLSAHHRRPSATPAATATPDVTASTSSETASTPAAAAAAPDVTASTSSQTDSTPAAVPATPAAPAKRGSLWLLIAFAVLVIVIGILTPSISRWRKRRSLEQTGAPNLSFTREASSDQDKSDQVPRKAA